MGGGEGRGEKRGGVGGGEQCRARLSHGPTRPCLWLSPMAPYGTVTQHGPMAQPHSLKALLRGKPLQYSFIAWPHSQPIVSLPQNCSGFCFY